jgi:hypothetical protein
MFNIFEKTKKIAMLFMIIALTTFPQFAFGFWTVYSLAIFGLPAGSITGIIIGIVQWILYIFGFLGILGFVIAGILYLLSTGDDDRMKKAKQAMQYSIIGIVVGLCGLIVIKAVFIMLNQGFYF